MRVLLASAYRNHGGRLNWLASRWHARGSRRDCSTRMPGDCVGSRHCRIPHGRLHWNHAIRSEAHVWLCVGYVRRIVRSSGQTGHSRCARNTRHKPRVGMRQRHTSSLRGISVPRLRCGVLGLVVYPVHAVHLLFSALPARYGIRDFPKLLFVNLLHMNDQSIHGVHAFVAHFTSEVFQLLVIDEDLLIVERPVAVVAEDPLLFLSLPLPPHLPAPLLDR